MWVPTEGEPLSTELLKVEHDLGMTACAARGGEPCIVQESIPNQAGVRSSDDPRYFSLVPRIGASLVPVVGPFGTDGFLAQSSVSPDGTAIALRGWKPKASGPGRYTVLHLFPTSNPEAIAAIDEPDELLDVVGWVGEGETLRAISRRGSRWHGKLKLSWFEVEPLTGVRHALEQRPNGIVVESSSSPRRAPNGKYQVACAT